MGIYAYAVLDLVFFLLCSADLYLPLPSDRRSSDLDIYVWNVGISCTLDFVRPMSIRSRSGRRVKGRW